MAGRLCIIPSYALGDERLSRTDLKVFNAIGSYTDKNGWCYPTQQTIADQIKVTRMSVSRSIKKLCQYGYLISRPRFRDNGSQSSNEYKVLLDKEWPEQEGKSGCNTPVTSPVTEMLPPCNMDVVGGVTSGCYTNERPTLTKKEITKVISKKENVPIAEVEVLQVEEWAKEHIPPSIKLEWQLGKFKDYWKASHKKPPRDGVAAFRNWLRNAVEYQAKAQHSSKATARHKDFEQQDYYANTDGFRTE